MAHEELVEMLCGDVPDLVAVYVFGSTARGDSNRESDLDLAFLAPRALDPTRRFDLQQRLAISARRDVDLLDLRAAPTVMRIQVIDGGEVLLDSDRSQRMQFEAETLSDYARLNEERRGILDDVRARGSIHG